MKIATWNVNSVKARLEAVTAWLKEAVPDVVCLQEIKSTDDTFPAAAFEELGYNCAVHGQKTYNGVAILSRRPLEDVTPRLPGGDGDDHARYLEAVVTGDKGVLRVASIYAPNGNPIGTEKFTYKLAWLERLRVHAAALLAFEEPLALDGRLQCHSDAGRLLGSQGLDGGCAVPAGIARGAAADRISRLHRCLPRLQRAALSIHVLGLSGGRLAKGSRHPHRSHTACRRKRSTG